MKVLESLKKLRGLPEIIVCDNDYEFTSKVFCDWAEKNNVNISYITPGKLIENCYIESFNGRFRDECLNENLFKNLQEAREKIKNFRNEYNYNRPHNFLNMLSPMEFLGSEELTKAA